MTRDDDEMRAMFAERRQEVIEEATGRCDRLFPIRYRPAVADLPGVLAWVERYQANAAEAPGLLLIGPTGTGKTWQAYGALRQAVTHPRPARGVAYRADAWRASTYADVLASMRPSAKNDPEAVLAELRKVALLLVDDLGVAKNSEWSEEITYRLINGRYEDMRPTIFTTNLAVDQLRDTIGDRIASRLAETYTRVLLTGGDRRRAPRSEESP